MISEKPFEKIFFFTIFLNQFTYFLEVAKIFTHKKAPLSEMLQSYTMQIESSIEMFIFVNKNNLQQLFRQHKSTLKSFP